MDKLEYVLTLAEERNLTRAASRLYISQPTLTNYLNRLEEELGIRLFDRTVQPIQITAAGQIYIEDKKKIQRRELALRSKLDSLKRKGQTFAVGVPPVRAAYDLPLVISQFMDRHPLLNLRIDNRMEEELEKDLAAGQIDVSIGMLSLAYPNVHYDLLHEDVLFLLVPRGSSCVADLPPDEGTPNNPYALDPDRLSEMTMLLPRVGGGHYRYAMQMMERHGIVPRNTIQCGNMNLLYQLVGEGVGFLFISAEPFIGAYGQYTNKIAFCTPQEAVPLQKSYIGYLEDNPRRSLVDEFVSLMKAFKNHGEPKAYQEQEAHHGQI